MHIENVSLKQVRNYNELHLSLNSGINILYGENAQGKTNFLESIYFCATGRSPRTHADKDLVQFGKTEARMKISVIKNKYTDRIDSHIKIDKRKGIAINGIPIRKLSELFGILLIVIFSPEDLLLVKAGPSERRKFIDMELCQLSAVYCYELQQYHKVLRQRNSLLKNIQKNSNLKNTLPVWNEQLCNHGGRIIDFRTEFIQKLDSISSKIYSDIAKNKENLKIIYKPSVGKQDFMDKLIKNTERDIYLGSTSNGIHKDEISFYINDHDARIFGSQGQQRTASLSAKLAEISLIQKEKKQNPVLLLDDVFSELDGKRQKQLVERISGIQTVLTCTGIEDILKYFKNSGNLGISYYEVKDGIIHQVDTIVKQS